VKEGFADLSSAIREKHYTESYKSYALIYEFESQGEGQQPTMVPFSKSHVGNCDTHLQKAGLLALLQTKNP